MKPISTKPIPILVSVTAFCLAYAAAAAPAVDVNFVEPDRYADASPDGPKHDRDAALAQLREHVQSLSNKHLKDGDRLTIDVLDVDLAGHLAPARSNSQYVRVMRDGDVPRIDLRYTLTRDGVTSSGEERISDLSYMRDPRRCRNADTLCHEKYMLDQWFARRLGSR